MNRDLSGDAAALELQDLHCIRGGRRLFNSLDLRVRRGELLWVQGSNGAGKTSLLRMICGLLMPTQGQVLWQGAPVASLREDFNRQLVYLGHAAALKAELSAAENLQAAAVLGGVVPASGDVAAALGRAGLRGREHVPSRTLSQGQRRRVALARLELSAAAPLWVLDEPFNALDTSATQWLVALACDHVARGGTVVLTSHQEVDLRQGVPPLCLRL